jgi:hypothetical protein
MQCTCAHQLSTSSNNLTKSLFAKGRPYGVALKGRAIVSEPQEESKDDQNDLFKIGSRCCQLLGMTAFTQAAHES